MSGFSSDTDDPSNGLGRPAADRGGVSRIANGFPYFILDKLNLSCKSSKCNKMFT